MTTIRTQLLTGFFTIIFVVTIVTVALVVVGSAAQREVERYDHALFLEYGLIDRADAVVRTFNQFRNAPTNARRDEYTAARDLLEADLRHTRELATAGRPRPSLDGASNTILSFMNVTDAGIEAIRNKDLTASSTAYNEAVRVRAFIVDATAALILEELEVSRDARAATDRRNQLVITIGIAVLAVTVVGSVYYAVTFSRRLSRPITELAQAASRISVGTYDVQVDKSLLENPDETGYLARSFDSMARNLKNTIDGLDRAREDAQRAQKDTQAKNELLEKLNQLFITREKRIAELKREIVRLGGLASEEAIDKIS